MTGWLRAQGLAPPRFADFCLALGASLVVLLVVYSPTLLRTFDFHDSFYNFVADGSFRCRRHPQAIFFIGIGRPIYGVLNCHAVGRLIHTVGDAVYVRLIAIALLGVSAAVVYLCLARCGLRKPAAIGVAALLHILPGFHLFLVVTQASPINYAVLGSTLAGLALIGTSACVEARRYGRAAVYFFIALVLLQLATLIFQQATPLLFALVFAICLAATIEDRQAVRCLIGLSVALYAVNGILFLAIYRWFILPSYLRKGGGALEEREIAFTGALADKLDLLPSLSERAFGLWLVGMPTAALVIALLAAVVLGANLWWDTRSVRGQGVPPGRRALLVLERFAYFPLFILLTNSPNLLAKGNSLYFRHVMPYQWLVILLLVVGGARFLHLAMAPRRWRLAAWSAASVLALLGCAYSAWNIDRNMAAPNEAELAFLRSELARIQPQPGDQICVIPPDVGFVSGWIDTDVAGDEFGKLTSMYWQDVPWLVRAAGRELGMYSARIGVPRPVTADRENPVTLGQDPGPITCTATIDMRPFVRQWLAERERSFLP